MGTMAVSVEKIDGAPLDHGGTVGALRAAYESGRTRSLAWRVSQLRGLLWLLVEEEEAAFRALREDLGKHRAEAYRDEVGVLVKSANAAFLPSSTIAACRTTTSYTASSHAVLAVPGHLQPRRLILELGAASSALGIRDLCCLAIATCRLPDTRHGGAGSCQATIGVESKERHGEPDETSAGETDGPSRVLPQTQRILRSKPVTVSMGLGFWFALSEIDI